MPMRKELYPVNWKEIAHRVKTLANWECQHCGKKCRRPKEKISDFIQRAFDLNSDAGIEAERHPQRFTLTVAHYPDHNPNNCSSDNLKAWCSVCHLRHDLEHHARNRKLNKITQDAGAALVSGR